MTVRFGHVEKLKLTMRYFNEQYRVRILILCSLVSKETGFINVKFSGVCYCIMLSELSFRHHQNDNLEVSKRKLLLKGHTHTGNSLTS